MSSFRDKEEEARIERMTVAAAETGYTPPWAAQYIRKAAPFIGVLGAGFEVIAPRLFEIGNKAYEGSQKLPQNAVKCAWGLGVCFYGGKYTVTIAAVEAFRVSGGTQMVTNLNAIMDQVKKVRDANSEDDKVDADKNGKPDVEEMDAKALARRKVALALKTVDPDVLSTAIGGFWTGYMGMLAVLKFKFAQTVALAHSIGDSMRPVAAKVLGPTLVAVFPKEYKKMGQSLH